MQGFVRASETLAPRAPRRGAERARRGAAALAACWLAICAVAAAAEEAAAPSAAGGAPGRVVSMNLCTDQLAMLVAAPGQLVAVSHLARDPGSSAMAEAARAYPVNRGRAEEIYLLAPDLVLAGRFSNPTTLEMLRRLGLRVAVLDPAESLDDVPARLAEVGRLLGREAAAAGEIARFEARRARLAAMAPPEAERPSAALYAANGYARGPRTLGGAIVAAAGLGNVAAEAGLQWGGFLPLELLAMADPDLVITGQELPGESRGEAILSHPVVAELRARTGAPLAMDRDWVCGTPHVLDAAERLALRARQIAPAGAP
jgi:iron complex transport system substrate-binding protein